MVMKYLKTYKITEVDPNVYNLKINMSEIKSPIKVKIIQFSSVSQSCLTLCDPMDCSTQGLPVHHQLREFTQTHVHWVGVAIQSSHPLLSPSPSAFNLSQHQVFSLMNRLFASGGLSVEASALAPVLSMNSISIEATKSTGLFMHGQGKIILY